MCWNHWVLKNYPLKTFWTVTMDIDSACQTKPLLIGSHHVYRKTNFFQVLLPNWNTLLQPSSLFIITLSSSHVTHPAKRFCNEGCRNLQQREDWRHLAIQILLYFVSCYSFGKYRSLSESCFYFTILLNIKRWCTNRALRLFNDPVMIMVSTLEWKYFKYLVYV